MKTARVLTVHVNVEDLSLADMATVLREIALQVESTETSGGKIDRAVWFVDYELLEECGFAPPVLKEADIRAALKRGAEGAKDLHQQLEKTRPTAETMNFRVGERGAAFRAIAKRAGTPPHSMLAVAAPAPTHEIDFSKGVRGKYAAQYEEMARAERGPLPLDARPHIIDGEFQSDKYPSCPRGKVPLSTEDPTAQDLLWEYAQRRRVVDAEFADDLETVLQTKGYMPPATAAAPIDLQANVRAVELMIHPLWGAAKDAPGYNKSAWMALQRAILAIVAGAPPDVSVAAAEEREAARQRELREASDAAYAEEREADATTQEKFDQLAAKARKKLFCGNDLSGQSPEEEKDSEIARLRALLDAAGPSLADPNVKVWTDKNASELAAMHLLGVDAPTGRAFAEVAAAMGRFIESAKGAATKYADSPLVGGAARREHLAAAATHIAAAVALDQKGGA